MQVVNLAECRDLLQVWAEVRSRIVKGELRHLNVSMADHGGEDIALFAGKKDQAAVQSAMRAMMELSREVDRLAAPAVPRVAKLRRRSD